MLAVFGDNRDGTFSRIAQLPLGASGVYSYDLRADTFTPLTTEKGNPLTQNLVGLSGNSFRKLRAAITRAVSAQ